MEKHTNGAQNQRKAGRPARPRARILEHWQVISLFLVVYDLIAVNFSYFAALWLRFDCRFSTIDSTYLQAWMKFVPIYSVVCLVIFYILKLYQSLWRFASYTELVRTAGGSLLAAAIHTVAITVLFHRMPISYYFVGAGLQFAFVIGIRFGYRLILLERTRQGRNAVAANGRPSRVMLIGAGAAGQMILRDMHCSPSLKQRVCCIIDDNPNKWNRYIDGVPIVGGREDILSCVKKYRIDKIYLAIPSADAATRRDILDICKETGCELKNLPGIYQFVLGEIKVGAMKDVAVEDLLGRDPIQVNMDEIFNYIKGKVVLVTGGGGSIGSELCRQIAGHNPKQLIIFDIYENNAYSIQLELKDRYPNLNLEVLIGSVRDSRKVNQLFAKYHPDVVYHAAAHKHVPLMEDSPCEAIKNNVVGTYKVAYAAMHNHCQRFVLISTDKAVNPTNIMGASKRLCEMVIQLFDQMIKAGQAAEIPALSLHEEGETLPLEGEAKTEFVAVRFGNVLGSNGSVIPLFKKQIANGGPVTVTHPDIIRYFMTIPEAVSLVLQAGTYAKGGEIFILDMGAPVKIDTLARNLIKLSGLKPDVDIMIEYTGLRPGEKLYEEKLMAEEGMRTTPNHLIHIGQPMTFDENLLLRQLEMLMEAAYDGREDIRDLVEQVVPTYHPAENSVRSENLVEKETACLTQTV